MFCIKFQELCEANKTHSMAIAEKGSHEISSSWRITLPASVTWLEFLDQD